MIDLNQIFNDSYERISTDPDAFFDEFYSCFFSKSKQIKALFSHVDMNNQRIILRESLIHLISFFSTKIANDYLLRLADIHKNKIKIDTQMYDIWLEALLEVVAKYDSKFNEDVEIAWRITLSPGIEFMKYYKNHSI